MRPALLLFVLGLLVRLLYWQATPDRELPYAACYQGDAPYWQQLAQAAAHPGAAQPTALKIPLRPPGTHWLVSALWDGDPATAWRMRTLFAVLGALVAPILFLALRQGFPLRVAFLASASCAVATGLLQLGSGVHGEIPYLLLFLLSMLDWERLRSRPGPWLILRWSLLHALATLVRAEHALVWVGLVALSCWPRGQGRCRAAALSVLAYGLCLLPWHLHAWAAIDRFNDEQPVLPERAALPWRREAVLALRMLPAFLQAPAFGFVTDTVAHRGGREVRAQDLSVLEEAYGSPLPGDLGRPFVALYGPLNFFLANSPEARGGFSAGALHRPPPLQGGPGRYPPGLLEVLPRGERGELSLGYPPHVRCLNEGWRLGWQWIAENPAQALANLADKLRFFWQGAASGLGGYALPNGASGTRRMVDLVTADGAIATGWRLLVLALCALGAFALRREPAARPWLWSLLAKVLVAAVFFGYARQGALCLPAVALLCAAALERHLFARLPRVPWRGVGWSSLVVLTVLETARWIAVPAIEIDGRILHEVDPWGADDYQVRRVDYR